MVLQARGQGPLLPLSTLQVISLYWCHLNLYLYLPDFFQFDTGRKEEKQVLWTVVFRARG